MKKTGFFAYPSQPLSSTVVIKKAIEYINDSGYDVEVKGWEANSVTGHAIIKRVTDAIDEADVFLCDLTYQNENVLFELGYAIASSKPVWICIDKGVHDKEKFERELGLLTT